MFKKISEGDVFIANDVIVRSSGSRTAVLPDGKLICSFMSNSASGVNNFIPWVCYSEDNGESWSEPVCLWKDYVVGKHSVFGSVRNTLDGRICYCGSSTPIAYDGQKFWSNKIGGMLENKLVFSISNDGYNFPEFTEVDLPYYGAAELPGGMLVDKDGTIMILYSPYRTIEQKEDTKVNQMVIVRSEDNGKTFTPYVVGEDKEPCQYGEAWLVKLSNGNHFISTWQTAVQVNTDRYLLSFDNAKTFTKPIPLPFNGQSTSCTPYKDGKVFVIYNQRKEEPKGVWLAIGKPDEKGFNMIANEPIWKAEKATRSGSSGEFDNWTDFAFGEPHLSILPDGKLLCTIWYDSGNKKGIRYVKLEIEE